MVVWLQHKGSRSQQQRYSRANKSTQYSIYELIGLSNSDWNLFLFDCLIFMKRDQKFQLSKDNLEAFKSEFNQQFTAKDAL